MAASQQTARESSMEVDLQYLEDLNILKIGHKGLFRKSAGDGQFAFNIQELSEQYDCKDLLVDLTELEIDRTRTGMYSLADHFRIMGIELDYKVALVYCRDEEFYRVLELVLRNRYYNVRFFKDEKKAIEWLQKRR